MTTRAILLRAAELIEERGHARGTPEDRRGRLCAIGAIAVALSGVARTSKWWKRQAAAQDLLVYSLRGRSIARWNDRSPDATVIAGLRKAAEAAG